ncbi:MAG: hypothetical protein M1817_001071 [Caeruleum heppii]|nr:MAG: hypothetical protein M1817_001071 [Caeruleum heppii]
MDQDGGDYFHIYTDADNGDPHVGAASPNGPIDNDRADNVSSLQSTGVMDFAPSGIEHHLGEEENDAERTRDSEGAPSHRSGSLRNSSGPSEDDQEGIFEDDDDEGHRSSPTTSHHSSSEGSRSPSPSLINEDHPDHLADNASVVSSFPGEYLDEQPASPYTATTPSRERPVFRNPSSVRAMRLDGSPPSTPTTPRRGSAYRRSENLLTSSPRSPRYSKDNSTFSHRKQSQLTTSSRSHSPLSPSMSTPKKKFTPLSPKPKLKSEHPLVLLHITLLASPPLPYPPHLLASLGLPPSIMANHILLQERIGQTVAERGLLIAHPREDFEVLEERVLEGLGLSGNKASRITKCGHFRRSSCASAALSDSGSDSSHEDADADDDADLCPDCGRHIRLGEDGDPVKGAGHKQWEIKVFAANGLMSAGAWTASWMEMERVDVEIGVWVSGGWRRTLDEGMLKMEEEELGRDTSHDGPEEAYEEDGAGKERVDKADDVDERRRSVELQRERLREIYGNDVPIPSTRQLPFLGTPTRDPTDHLHHPRHPLRRPHLNTPSPLRPRSQSSTQPTPHIYPPSPASETGIAGNPPRGPTSAHQRGGKDDIPITHLLRNYIYLLAQDPRNILIFVLSILVLFIAIKPSSGSPHMLSPAASSSSAAQYVTEPVINAVEYAVEGAKEIPQAMVSGAEAVMRSASDDAKERGSSVTAAIKDGVEEVGQFVAAEAATVKAVVGDAVHTMTESGEEAVSSGKEEVQAS